MKTPDFRILNAEQLPAAAELQSAVEWPEFILHDPVGLACWERLFTTFPTWQLTVLSGAEIVGTANTIPLHLDPAHIDYNDRGWDWALEKGFDDYAQGLPPTVLCGLQIGITEPFKGQNLSRLFIDAMRELAQGNGLQALILPIRPTLKHKYPLIAMEDYIGWKTPSGEPFDPWIRAHVRLGAEIKGICHRAMCIDGTPGEWTEWTGLSFQSDGEYVVAGALAPVRADLKHNRVEYTEPNVWMIHGL